MPQDPVDGRQIRIVIADDHPVFRFGLRRLLETDGIFSVVGEAADGVAALDFTRQLRPDVLLLDLAMPKLGGLECLESIDPEVRVVILTAAVSDTGVAKAFRLGAKAVVLKETATRRLIDTVRRVVAGEYVVDDGPLGGLLNVLRQARSPEVERRFNLTPRERDIVTSVAAGRTNRDIAENLGISTQTVKHHLTSIFDKTGVSGRLELALFALRHGLTDG